jgi:hypothetical protein
MALSLVVVVFAAVAAVIVMGRHCYLARSLTDEQRLFLTFAR